MATALAGFSLPKAGFCLTPAETQEEPVKRLITQNAERRTQNAERRTQNAERRTQNAERRTQNALCAVAVRWRGVETMHWLVHGNIIRQTRCKHQEKSLRHCCFVGEPCARLFPACLLKRKHAEPVSQAGSSVACVWAESICQPCFVRRPPHPFIFRSHAGP